MKKCHAHGHFSLCSFSNRLNHSSLLFFFGVGADFKGRKEIFVKYCCMHERHGEFQQHCDQVYILESFFTGKGVQGENQDSLVKRGSGLYRENTELILRQSDFEELGNLHVGKPIRTIVCGSGTQDRGHLLVLLASRWDFRAVPRAVFATE